MSLVRQRCFLHAEREAVARCPECGRTYCRECVTEHDGRVLCASCLVQLNGAAAAGGGVVGSSFTLVLFVVALLTQWFVFNEVGRILLRLPDDFHERSVWERFWQSS